MAAKKTKIREVARSISKTSKKRTKKHVRKNINWRLIIPIAVSVIALIVSIFLINMAMRNDYRVMDFNKRRVVGYKEDFTPDDISVCYGNFFGCEKIEMSVDASAVNVEELGEYTVVYTGGKDDTSLRVEQIVEVKDIRPPVIEVSAEKLSVCKNGTIAEFDHKVTDDYDGDLTDRADIRFDDNSVRISSRDSHGNASERKIPGVIEDKRPPRITLNGGDNVTVKINEKYNDAGATATDECDGDVQVSVNNKVNTGKVGKYEVIYTAADSSGNSSEIKRVVNVVQPWRAGSGSVIYLTFDDGPSQYTGKLLDVLKRQGVPATFFVTGNGQSYNDMIKRAANEGHAIGLHSYTHNYNQIYRNQSAYFDDLYRIQNMVKDLTGQTSMIMRFPGGSSNTVSRSVDGGARIMSQLVKAVPAKGFSYFDWNVSSGDAGGATSAEAVYQNVIRSLKNGSSSVVLQHDTKGFSVDAVERIIIYGKEHGFSFAKLEPGSFGAHHGVNN